MLLVLLVTIVLLVLLVLLVTIVLLGSLLRTYHRAAHMVSFMWIDHMAERAVPIPSFLSGKYVDNPNHIIDSDQFEIYFSL